MTISRVAELAGVARATLYHYFESKDQLLAEVTIAQAADVTAALQASPPMGGSPSERVAEMLVRIVDWGLAKPRLFEALANSWTSPNRRASGAQRKLVDGMLERIRVVIGDDIPGDELAVARVIDHVVYAVLVQLSIGVLTREEAIEDVQVAARLIVRGAGISDSE